MTVQTITTKIKTKIFMTVYDIIFYKTINLTSDVLDLSQYHNKLVKPA